MFGCAELAIYLLIWPSGHLAIYPDLASELLLRMSHAHP
jgi:hypothetical protein